MQRSRRYRNRSRTPPAESGTGSPMIINPVVRKLLQDMTPAERRDWFGSQQTELEAFCTYAQAYLKGRQAGGQHTNTDDRYQQFLTKAADLINGLAELHHVAAIEAAKEGE